LAQDQNLAGLEAINRELIARTESVDSRERVVLDMDSTEIPVYWLLLAEGHLNRRRFKAMLGRIAVLPLRTG
jgi:hypothetical protein